MDIREVYVQSCGLAQEHDYCWVKVTQEGQHIREIPTILQEAHDKNKGRLTDQYDSHDPSLVLAEHGQKILLLVTGLQANERTEIYRRQVRNSVAIVASSEDKQILKEILNHIRCNWETFRAKIDNAVTFDDDQNYYGFKVDRDLVKKSIQEIRETPISDEPDQRINVVKWPLEEQPNNFFLIPLLIIFILMLIVMVAVISIQKPKPETLPTPSTQTQELQKEQPTVMEATPQENQLEMMQQSKEIQEEQLVKSSIENYTRASFTNFITNGGISPIKPNLTSKHSLDTRKSRPDQYQQIQLNRFLLHSKDA